MSELSYLEGRITIDFGLSEHGHHELQIGVEGPTEDADLPHRMLVEGALSMARDSLDELYAGEDDDG